MIIPEKTSLRALNLVLQGGSFAKVSSFNGGVFESPLQKQQQEAEQMDKAKECKAEGNSQFTSGNHHKALDAYTTAISILMSFAKDENEEARDLLIACFANSAQCCLNIGENEDALNAADVALHLIRNRHAQKSLATKLLLRKSHALLRLERVAQATETIRELSLLSPHDPQLASLQTQVMAHDQTASFSPAAGVSEVNIDKFLTAVKSATATACAGNEEEISRVMDEVKAILEEWRAESDVTRVDSSVDAGRGGGGGVGLGAAFGKCLRVAKNVHIRVVRSVVENVQLLVRRNIQGHPLWRDEAALGRELEKFRRESSEEGLKNVPYLPLHGAIVMAINASVEDNSTSEQLTALQVARSILEEVESESGDSAEAFFNHDCLKMIFSRQLDVAILRMLVDHRVSAEVRSEVGDFFQSIVFKVHSRTLELGALSSTESDIIQFVAACNELIVPLTSSHASAAKSASEDQLARVADTVQTLVDRYSSSILNPFALMKIRLLLMGQKDQAMRRAFAVSAEIIRRSLLEESAVPVVSIAEQLKTLSGIEEFALSARKGRKMTQALGKLLEIEEDSDEEGENNNNNNDDDEDD